MISASGKTVAQHSPQLLAPLARCFRSPGGPAGPKLLGLLTMPIACRRLAPCPNRPASTASPSFRLLGSSCTNTLVGAALLQSSINRRICGISKSAAPDGGKSADDVSIPGQKLNPPDPSKNEPDTGKILIAKVPWFYDLHKIKDHYILSVMCGTAVEYCLDIQLDSQEISMALSDPASLEAFAAKIRQSPESYVARDIKYK